MSSMPFRVGDFVTVTGKGKPHFGMTGRVVEIRKEGKGMIYRRVQFIDGSEHLYHSRALTRATKEVAQSVRENIGAPVDGKYDATSSGSKVNSRLRERKRREKKQRLSSGRLSDKEGFELEVEPDSESALPEASSPLYVPSDDTLSEDGEVMEVSEEDDVQGESLQPHGQEWQPVDKAYSLPSGRIYDRRPEINSPPCRSTVLMTVFAFSSFSLVPVDAN
jgi:hypothetical protein